MHSYVTVMSTGDLKKALPRQDVALQEMLTIHIRDGGVTLVTERLPGPLGEGYEECCACGWAFETAGGHHCPAAQDTAHE